SGARQVFSRSEYGWVGKVFFAERVWVDASYFWGMPPSLVTASATITTLLSASDPNVARPFHVDPRRHPPLARYIPHVTRYIPLPPTSGSSGPPIRFHHRHTPTHGLSAPTRQQPLRPRPRSATPASTTIDTAAHIHSTPYVHAQIHSQSTPLSARHERIHFPPFAASIPHPFDDTLIDNVHSSHTYAYRTTPAQRHIQFHD
ncbi:hypothetical protein B0H16DRAFT_1778969, partial [Mycena metata]